MEMGSTSFEGLVGVDQAMRKKILYSGMDCALPLGRVQSDPWGRERGGGTRYPKERPM